MHLVFVYGTLKRGYRNSYLLADSRFLGDATTVENFLMTGYGIPFVIFDECAEYPISGEVYEVDDPTLKRLDSLEGYREGREGNLYERTLIKVRINDKVTEAFIYLGGSRAVAHLNLEEEKDRFLTEANLLEWPEVEMVDYEENEQ